MADELIKKLKLNPHPADPTQCCWVTQTYCSSVAVVPQGVESSAERKTLNAVHLIIKHGPGKQFDWHKNKSDEAFLYHKGCPLKIHQIKSNGEYECTVVGDVEGGVWHHVVPGGTWFSQHPVTSKEGEYTLCSVLISPAYSDDDVVTLKDPEELCKAFPSVADKIRDVSAKKV